MEPLQSQCLNNTVKQKKYLLLILVVCSDRKNYVWLKQLSREYSVMKAVVISGQIVELMCSEMKNECCCYNVLFTVISSSTSVTWLRNELHVAMILAPLILITQKSHNTGSPKFQFSQLVSHV